MSEALCKAFSVKRSSLIVSCFFFFFLDFRFAGFSVLSGMFSFDSVSGFSIVNERFLAFSPNSNFFLADSEKLISFIGIFLEHDLWTPTFKYD